MWRAERQSVLMYVSFHSPQVPGPAGGMGTVEHVGDQGGDGRLGYAEGENEGAEKTGQVEIHRATPLALLAFRADLAPGSMARNALYLPTGSERCRRQYQGTVVVRWGESKLVIADAGRGVRAQ